MTRSSSVRAAPAHRWPCCWRVADVVSWCSTVPVFPAIPCRPTSCGRAVGVRTEGLEARAAVVVGADGMNSSIASAVGAAISREHPSLTCGFYAYWRDVPTDGVEFRVREGGDVLVFPTHDALTCIWVGRA